MLYTRKGDNGMTSLFGCDQRFTKSSVIAEALGTVDELNSFLGLCRARASVEKFLIGKRAVSEIIEEVQQNLFIVQAELAGADKHITHEKIVLMEDIISEIEKTLPPIHSFFIPGSTELGAFFDVARTIARRAERRVVALYIERDENATPYGQDETKSDLEIHEQSLIYSNRLSSLLYALARLANHTAGMQEGSPTYK